MCFTKRKKKIKKSKIYPSKYVFSEEKHQAREYTEKKNKEKQGSSPNCNE